MEKSENRLKFTDNLNYFKENVKLTQKFLDELNRHELFKSYKKPLKELSDDNERKLFILLELTRERCTCAAIVKLLRDFGQQKVAERLEEYNKSPGLMKLSYDVDIEVAKCVTPIIGRSNTYTLKEKTRGKCIIINNVEDPQCPAYDEKGNVLTTVGLKRETLRFEKVFKQLHFDVEVITNLSVKQMVQQLTEIRKSKVKEKDEAFALIVISHGEDKKVLGYKACEAMRKIRFEIETPEEKATSQYEIESDIINIKDLVKIFAEENCLPLKSKPKLFFFICCRNNSVTADKLDSGQSSTGVLDKQIELEEIKDQVKRKEGKPPENLDTFISYSCARGSETIYDLNFGMSYFGLAFTQSIAQFACEEPLNVIMNRTFTRLVTMFEEYKKECKSEQTLTIDRFAIQFNTYAMKRQLFFNPGYQE